MTDLLVELLIPTLALAASPIVGGLLTGIDRKITARMQSRIGPPVLQPFYDVIKLWGKKPFITGSLQPVLAFGYLGFSVVAVAMLFFGLDMLLLTFVVIAADICLIAASMNSKSPFSYLGGRREFFSMLSSEPVMILSIISIYFVTGSFLVGGIFSMKLPLLLLLPGVFLALGMILLIELKKSPFDVSASSHAHQELVRGVYTEFSGYTMAMIEIGHWVKTALVLSIICLFWATNLIIGAGLAFLMFFAAIVADNVYPRLTWQRMLRISWAVGFTLIIANIIVLMLLGGFFS